jgi:SAM-dependent methyltransferase
MSNEATLDELLSVFWLRPETALWREIDIQAMKGFQFESPSLDLGCGDGLFSFLRAGGRFSPEFDAFQVVSGLDGFFNNVDVFDAYDESLMPGILKKAAYGIDFAFDHKENLLKKASHLGLYGVSKIGDANKPLPFESGSIRTVFSNIVYWLDNPQAVFLEVSRILCTGGRACFMLPNRTLPEFSFFRRLYYDTKDPKWAFLEKLDRGRFDDNIRQSRSPSEWEQMFAQSGLHVVGHRRHLSKTVIQMWDVGLRPLFPVLKRMTAKLSPDDLLDIKAEWIDILKQFLEPIANMDADLCQGEEPAFHCYIVEK